VTAAPIPQDEEARMRALLRLAILDTEAEQAFDDAVQLAAMICDTPTALISMIDSDRQWFKARHGWDGDSTAREIAVCAYTIDTPDHLLIEDLATDPRFPGHPAVEEFGLRFYAGVPLRVQLDDGVGAGGSGIGTLCVADTVPRRLSDADLTALKLLARQIERLLAARTEATEHQRLRAVQEQLRERFDVVTRSMPSG
jgi:GAF domain-containing protein